MSDHLDDIRDAVTDIIDQVVDSAQPDGVVDVKAWRALDELGFTCLTMPTELGGSDGDVCDAAAVVGAAALANLPLGEALLLAAPLLAAAGIPWPDAVTTAAIAPDVHIDDAGSGPLLSGRAHRVPWLRGAQRAVLLLTGGDGSPVVAVIDTDSDGVSLHAGSNVAGEPRDELILHAVRPTSMADLPSDWSATRFTELGAVCRISQMAGASRQAMLLTTRHVADRVQFGRPLAKFQAVQQMLARLAADVATVRVAADAAAMAMRDEPGTAGLTVATAKAESSALARGIAAVSHQIHGALGFSQEHGLGASTRRLWAWREEFGNEVIWQQTLADYVAAAPGGLWPLLTNTTSRLAVAARPQ